jgi:hypothetical protein
MARKPAKFPQNSGTKYWGHIQGRLSSAEGIFPRNSHENRSENAVFCLGGNLPALRHALPWGKRCLGQTMTVDGGYVAQ